MQNKKVIFQDWGSVDYQEAWEKQETIFAEIVAQKVANRTNSISTPTDNYLIFVEHPHVYTLGKSGKAEHLLLDDAGLKEKSATRDRL